MGLFGKRKYHPKTEIAYQAIHIFINQIAGDKRLFPQEPPFGYAGVLLGLCCFLISGMTGRDDVAEELVLKYGDALPKTQRSILMQRVNEFYRAFREVAIELQTESNEINNIVQGLSWNIADLLAIPQNEDLLEIIDAHVFAFINSALPMVK